MDGIPSAEWLLVTFIVAIVGIIIGIYAISEGVALGKKKYDDRKRSGEYD